MYSSLLKPVLDPLTVHNDRVGGGEYKAEHTVARLSVWKLPMRFIRSITRPRDVALIKL